MQNKWKSITASFAAWCGTTSIRWGVVAFRLTFLRSPAWSQAGACRACPTRKISGSLRYLLLARRSGSSSNAASSISRSGAAASGDDLARLRHRECLACERQPPHSVNRGWQVLQVEHRHQLVGLRQIEIDEIQSDVAGRL